MDANLLDEAMKAGSAKELREMAKTRGIELTEAEAENYYCRMHRLGELSDDELSDVAGGGCHQKDGRLVVSYFHSCDQFVCKSCGRSGKHTHHVGNIVTIDPSCELCKYCSYEKGLWLCNNPANIK